MFVIFFFTDFICFIRTAQMALQNVMCVCAQIDHFEGFRPEWCISSMIYSRDTPFWSGTLNLFCCMHSKVTFCSSAVGHGLTNHKKYKLFELQDIAVHVCFLKDPFYLFVWLVGWLFLSSLCCLQPIMQAVACFCRILWASSLSVTILSFGAHSSFEMMVSLFFCDHWLEMTTSSTLMHV